MSARRTGAVPASEKRHSGSTMGRDIAFGLALGAALGLFAALAERSIITTSLGQMVTPWVLVAAYVGARASQSLTSATVAGALSMIGANATYYLFGVALSAAVTPRYWVLWTAVGLVVGPAAAVIGWHAGPEGGERRGLAVAALAAVPIAEAVVLWGHIDHPDAHATYAVVAVVGALLPAGVLHRLGRRAVLRSMAATAALTVVCGVVFEYAFQALGIVG